jgi:hypothetical protein
VALAIAELKEVTMVGPAAAPVNETDPQRAAESVLLLIEGAAEAARRREAEARAAVANIAHELHASQALLAQLEADVREAQRRSDGAEEWLSNVFEHAQQLTEALKAATATTDSVPAVSGRRELGL